MHGSGEGCPPRPSGSCALSDIFESEYNDERAVDDLHSALLDLLMPGHGETAEDRARSRERVAPLMRSIEQDETREGEGGA